MIARVYPGTLNGRICAPPSKSCAQRLLICAALSEKATYISCAGENDDISLTARCLGALCADIVRDNAGYDITPMPVRRFAKLDCGESGAAFRFLLPVVCALGVNAQFTLRGRLPQRPVGALCAELCRHGAVIKGEGTSEVTVSGRATGGDFVLPGDVSSQFISGILLALPLLGNGGTIRLSTPLESRGYVDMTLDVLRTFGIKVICSDGALTVPGGQAYKSPARAEAEGDWSGMSCLLCAAAFGGKLEISGLNAESTQADAAISSIIKRFGYPMEGLNADIADTPDLAPAIALLGAAAMGVTRITGIKRLRFKESDRAESITKALRALGADITLADNAIEIRGGKRLRGGRTDAFGDHRIAMMTACAAVLCECPVEISGAEAVSKTYPGFFDDLEKSGLKVEREETII